ncbi:MAG: twin-arginine translocation signal domain-containing protein, partial [Desulfobacteraceae bacterium]|nr:twin-arginine translocation signal domain-containing protein [Desulfobacteraceae bacterium]
NKKNNKNRRGFLKKAGLAALAAGTASIGGLFSSTASAGDDDDAAIKRYWQKKQAKLETIEQKHRQKHKAFGSPPKYIYRGTDYTDDKATFYAPLMEECKYLPEFQSIFSGGTAGQYFRHTMKFGMKDIIKFHGHSCEALYYTAAICRLICDELFEDNVVDRTVLRGMGGKSPCIGDSLVYITGGRTQFGTFNIDPSLGHAVVLQRIDTQETWMGAWKDGVQSWNAIKIFGSPNKANPLPYKRWSAWKHESDTPANQIDDCKIKWKYSHPEQLQRLRDLKDNLKYLPKGVAPKEKPDEIREEFNWLQYAHLREVFSHPLAESFQIKKVKNFKWQYPHCEPMWVPRLDQKAKWAKYMEHPKMSE